MVVTVFSNFLNHHQTPFCDEMYELLNGNFTFVSTIKTPVELLKSGYLDCSEYIYNLKTYISQADYKKALQLGVDSDIVIIGSAPEIFIKERLLLNKHTFRISERLLKQSDWLLCDPRVLLSLLRYHTVYRKRNLYMLCSGAYTANDLGLVFAYPHKKYKWGYFTEVEKLNIEQIISKRPIKRIEIIWTGRFLDWKHPELAVQLAIELKKKGYNFHINMIGMGALFNYIEKLIQRLGVSECVTLLGTMPNKEVRDYMKKSNIFIFTSDRNEGWGAVLNEAMSSGCAVITSNSIGAVPYLIEPEKNGLIFKSGSLSSLLKQTERLFNDQMLREELGKSAYYTLVNEWNPSKAASNFIMLSMSLLTNNKFVIEKGPCSPA